MSAPTAGRRAPREDGPTWRQLPSAAVMETFGRRMRTRRMDLGWSLVDMAQVMTEATGGAVRITAPTLRTYETSERSPFLATAVFIAQTLGVRVGELVGEEVADRGDRLASDLGQLLVDYLNREQPEATP